MPSTNKTSIALTLMTPLAAMILASCARNEAAEAPAAPPPVQAAKVVLKSITEFDEFTGRFEAVERVELRPRVSGYVLATRFAQGHEVKKGDTLGAILNSEPEPIAQLNPEVPAPLRWIAERCLAKDPDHRYASTTDLASPTTTAGSRSGTSRAAR